MDRVHEGKAFDRATRFCEIDQVIQRQRHDLETKLRLIDGEALRCETHQCFSQHAHAGAIVRFQFGKRQLTARLNQATHDVGLNAMIDFFRPRLTCRHVLSHLLVCRVRQKLIEAL